jgi:NADH-quinone oxidoreductase subunit J
VNIIVYAGAIMVLFLFVIMFLNVRDEGEENKSVLVKIGAAISAGCFLLVMVGALKQVKMDMPTLDPATSQIGMVENLGKVLFTQFLLPFELASILLLVAMVGAVLLARREEGERNTF